MTIRNQESKINPSTDSGLTLSEVERVKNQKWESRQEAAESSIVRQLMQKGTQALEKAGIENPRGEVELILSEATGFSRSELYLNRSSKVSPHARRFFERAIDKRCKRFPLQYILNRQRFRQLDIRVQRGVFIPRPETELVVEEALKIAGRMVPPLTVVDVCTGSGAIALSIAHEMEGAMVFALDVSSRALSVARRNASTHNLSHKICFLKSNLLSSLPLSLREKVDLIVANPPYVAASLLPRLQPELVFEPPMALDGGEDGLRFYPALIQQAYVYLKPKGALVAELGQSAEAVRALFVKTGFLATEILSDFNGHSRIILGYKNT